MDFRDERFLPFEGSGAESQWRLELPTAVRQFDYQTISDVELQIQYTARNGGSSFRTDVEDALNTDLNAALDDGVALMLSAKSAFPVAWEKFLYPATGEENDPLSIPVVLDRLPFALRNLAPQAVALSATFILEPGTGSAFSTDTLNPTLTPSGGVLDFNTPGATDTTATAAAGPITATALDDDEWSLSRGDLTILDADRIKDLIIVVDLDVTVS